MKIDQIFIGDILDKKTLGIYSASQKLYDIAYSFISMAFFSLFPKIAALFERNRAIFEEKSRQLIFLFTFFAVFTAIFIFFWGDAICALLYGAKYAGAEKIVVYHFAALIFVANGFMRSGFLTVQKSSTDLIYINLTTAVLMLPLNYFVIKKFGIEGAAAMTVVLQAFAFWLSNLFFASTRPFFFLQTRAMLKIFDIRAYYSLLKKFI
jgi:O-antigen/teichoic acid export membrane protein